MMLSVDFLKVLGQIKSAH